MSISRQTHRLGVFLGAGVAFFIAGCGSSSSAGSDTAEVAKNPIGKYAGTYSSTEKDESFKVVITEAGTFEASMKGGSNASTASGTAALSGDTISLTATKIDGEAPKTDSDKKPEILKIQEDGKVLQPEHGPKLTKE